MSFQEKAKRLFLMMLERVANNEIDVDIYQWPPNCSAWFHQPERPVIEEIEAVD